MKSKIPYVKFTTDDQGQRIQVIPLNYARFGAVFYFILGLLIGGLLF